MDIILKNISWKLYSTVLLTSDVANSPNGNLTYDKVSHPNLHKVPSVDCLIRFLIRLFLCVLGSEHEMASKRVTFDYPFVVISHSISNVVL